MIPRENKGNLVAVDKNTIKTLVSLSRISCTEEEQEDLLQNMQKILSYIDLLNELNTENVTPCNQVIPQTSNVMRKDEIGNLMPREAFLENAPSQIGGMVKIPPVFKAN